MTNLPAMLNDRWCVHSTCPVPFGARSGLRANQIGNGLFGIVHVERLTESGRHRP